MDSKSYYDNDAVRQVIGCIFKEPSLLDQNGQYFLTAQDFINDVHRVIYGAASNLYANGAEAITPIDVENYIRGREKSYVIYKSSNGAEYLRSAIEYADPDSFKYYYDKIKKMTLLRNYCNTGVDVSWIYDPNNLIDKDKKEKQLNELDDISLSELADKVENRIAVVRLETIDKNETDAIKLGDFGYTVYEQLKQKPEVGMPFSFGVMDGEMPYSHIMNRVTYGARRGKFFLRSAPTGTGKTRAMLADALMLACRKIYIQGKWVSLVEEGTKREGVLFISTEQSVEEIMTMSWAFLTGINEEKLITMNVTPEENALILEAIKEIDESPIYFFAMPDYTITDVENTIKKYHIQNKCNYFFYDYLGTSLGILEEISSKTRGMKMREDNVLFILSTKLKELAIKYDIFIESATQLSGDFRNSLTPDQSLLRGAKSIGDRLDLGCILLPPTEKDMEDIRAAGYVSKWGVEPNMKLSIYKNRRGKYTNCYIWMYADRGTCRFIPLGATTWNLRPLDIAPLNITAYGRGGEKNEL